MKILIADDDRLSRHMLKSTLERWGYEITVAKDGFQAWQILQSSDSPQLAVLDWLMPGIDGAEICRRLRSQPQDNYKYIVLLTGKSQKKDIIEGLDSGADDYITKPWDAFELEARIRTGKRIIDLQEALRMQASHDQLTRLWNRAAIFDMVERELARSKRNGTSMAVVAVDVDHFKRINDSFGHLAGDAVLFEVAQRITLSIRAYDSVGRQGGEEFLIVAPETTIEGGIALAERVRREIEREPVLLRDRPLAVTASFGVAATGGVDRNLEDLINAADRALYVSKDRGRNRVHAAQETGFASFAPVRAFPVQSLPPASA